jgi:hypothetical protein
LHALTFSFIEHIFLYRLHLEGKLEMSAPWMDELKNKASAEPSTYSFHCITTATAEQDDHTQQTTIRRTTHLSIAPNPQKPFDVYFENETVVEPDSYKDDDEDYVDESETVVKKSTRQTRRTRNSSSTSPSPSSSPVTPSSPVVHHTSEKKRRKQQQTDNAHGEQTECCLNGCHNTVTNRLRFSLRCHKNEDFKTSFLNNGWHKVCHYHYFSDLYKYKKMNHGSSNTSKSKSSKKAAASSSPKRVAGQKRKRVDSEEEFSDENTPFELTNAEESSSKRVKHVENQDADIFCNFIAMSNKPEAAAF